MTDVTLTMGESNERKRKKHYIDKTIDELFTLRAELDNLRLELDERINKKFLKTVNIDRLTQLRQGVQVVTNRLKYVKQNLSYLEDAHYSGSVSIDTGVPDVGSVLVLQRDYESKSHDSV
jgi:hypothetical protein